MRTIRFTPGGFVSGVNYFAELEFNGAVVGTINNLVENQERTFTVTSPGNYLLRVRSQIDSSCLFSQSVQVFYPITTFIESDVDCNNNTYLFNITLTNPSTAGTNIQFGWSLLNDCSSVTNWTDNPNFIIPADDVVRNFFVKNNNISCCTQIISTLKSPCTGCDLTVTNISFTCG